jgi:probable HAF family extracellular repeat protein
MKFHRHWVVSSLAVAVFSAISAVPAWADYTLTDLGTGSYATAINNNGQVVGSFFDTASGFPHAFLYSNGSMTDLGTLPNLNVSRASGINNNGQVVGVSYHETNFDIFGPYHAFLYSNGSMTDLGGQDSLATAINNNSQVAGFAHSGNGGYHAFLYSNGSMTDLGTLGGSNSYAYGINDNGQVVGWSDFIDSAGNFTYHAFLYSNGSMTDLDTLWGSGANGINSDGQVVGWNGPHAFLYSNGSMTDLGTLGTSSTANSINNKGQVVGNSYTKTNGPSHAFIYDGGSMLDLNNLISSGSGWTLQDATGINDLGQIVGIRVNAQGLTDAFLLTPTTVPIPAAVWLFGSGLLGLIGMARRKAA